MLLCPYGNSKRQNWCDPDSWCETQWKKSVKEIRFEIYPRDKNSGNWLRMSLLSTRNYYMSEQVKLLENWNQMVDKSCTSLVYPWSILPYLQLLIIDAWHKRIHTKSSSWNKEKIFIDSCQNCWQLKTIGLLLQMHNTTCIFATYSSIVVILQS